MNTTTEMQLVPIDKLIPYVNNARTHSPEQLNKLRSSLREFGFINPVIIDRDFNVIAGHGRILAAKAENISEVPCVFVDYLTPAQKKAYIIADNRMALDAGWDEEMLKVEIEVIMSGIMSISFTVSEIPRAKVNCMRISEVLTADSVPETRAEGQPPLKGGIRLKGVSYRYPAGSGHFFRLDPCTFRFWI